VKLRTRALRRRTCTAVTAHGITADKENYQAENSRLMS